MAEPIILFEDTVEPIELVPSFPTLPGLRYVLSTRHGGVSSGPYASLNLGYHVGDDPALVTENRRRLGNAAGYDPSALVCAQQVHGVGIAVVDAGQRGAGACSWESALPDTDGLVVADAGIPVAIQVADCAPVLLVDPVQHVLAVVHAGWRGALGRIASRAVILLAARYHSLPEQIVAGIGPALCPGCLEVGEDVAATVARAFGAGVLRQGSDKPHLDLPAMLVADLTGAGVPTPQVHAHPACTRCRNDRYFSHRGQQGCAGRQALVAWWE